MTNSSTNDVVVEIIESDRLLGQDVRERTFPDINAAVQFCVRFNKGNDEDKVPEYYCYARIEGFNGMIRTREDAKHVVKTWKTRQAARRFGL